MRDRLMRCRLVVLITSALIAGASDGVFAQRNRFEMEVHAWTYAVRHHRPGTLDQHATDVAALSWPILAPILQYISKKAEPVLLLRGATLLLDIAVHIPVNQRPHLRDIGFATLAQDGAQRGTAVLDSHLWWARRLVDGAVPDPAADSAEMRAHAIAWYRTVTALLAGTHNLADLQPHIQRSLQLFPEDAGVRFDAGCYAEVFASPMFQAAMFRRGEEIPSRMKPVDLLRTYGGSPRALLEEAERQFRRAVEHDPSWAEARVRLGRVLTMRDRAAAAVVELRQAVRIATNNTVRYYALLFLGGALEKSNDAAGAMDAFRSAAALFPNAQSPQLAISRLAAEAGDNRAARQAVDRMFSNPEDAVDPWWLYSRGSGRDAESIYREFAARIRKVPAVSSGAPVGRH